VIADSTRTTPEPASTTDENSAFEVRLRELRPRLHRYCARMTGSIFDGEDVLQETYVKALQAFAEQHGEIVRLESWLFRIANNTALDWLRRRARQESTTLPDENASEAADTASGPDTPAEISTGLRRFMQLPVIQRSSVILMDVLGYELQEIAAMLEVSVAAVKSALHRGRARLAELAREAEPAAICVLPPRERVLLERYVTRFNARDFDAVRDMLADEVKLDLVQRVRYHGKAKVSTYMHNYEGVAGWRFSIGIVEGRDVIVVRDPNFSTDQPAYLICLDWQDDRVTSIRDFRYARYVMDCIEISASHRHIPN